MVFPVAKRRDRRFVLSVSRKEDRCPALARQRDRNASLHVGADPVCVSPGIRHHGAHRRGDLCLGAARAVVRAAGENRSLRGEYCDRPPPPLSACSLYGACDLSCRLAYAAKRGRSALYRTVHLRRYGDAFKLHHIHRRAANVPAGVQSSSRNAGELSVPL